MRLRSRRQIVPKHERDVQVGARLRRFRREAELSQSALALMVGLTGQTIAHYEKGHYTVPDVTLTKLATALGIARSLLADGEFNAVSEMVPVLERITDPSDIMVLKATAEAMAAKDAA